MNINRLFKSQRPGSLSTAEMYIACLILFSVFGFCGYFAAQLGAGRAVNINLFLAFSGGALALCFIVPTLFYLFGKYSKENSDIQIQTDRAIPMIPVETLLPDSIAVEQAWSAWEDLRKKCDAVSEIEQASLAEPLHQAERSFYAACSNLSITVAYQIKVAKGIEPGC